LRRLLPLVFVVLRIASAPARAQSGLPPVLADVRIDQRLGEAVPLDLAFKDERGEDVRLGRYFGAKPVLLMLVYYQCPMLCTEILSGTLRALRVLPFDVGREFEVVTVSFDPDETPEMAALKKDYALSRYGREGAAAGWHFLTGSEPSIRALTDAVGFRYTRDPETGQFAHASGVIVLTPAGKLSRYFYGIEYSPKDLRLGLVEASSRRSGRRSPPALLLPLRPANGPVRPHDPDRAPRARHRHSDGARRLRRLDDPAREA